MGKNFCKSTLSVESRDISINFHSHSTKLSSGILHYIYGSPHLTFSIEAFGQVIFSPQDQRKCPHGNRKRTHLPGECHFMTNQLQLTDFKFPNENRLDVLTITKTSKNKTFTLTETHAVSTKPTVPCAEVSWSVLEF